MAEWLEEVRHVESKAGGVHKFAWYSNDALRINGIWRATDIWTIDST
eukprot:CAMPEP_0176301734 /NCGR_PEP_ID=MMETSP0121_2-20121125/61009_1 /TAXON_ID=160619 /ORGANISM="Kryptoperidinium foliaceum, Strain CCMP 1326" /LENGTH=46 /DNA_ID= /DNA_START= /DNA_END= /DNA_ORIENTATION=